MPVISRTEAKLSDIYKTAPGGKIRKEIVRAGWALDGRTLTNNDIKELYTETKSSFLDRGILVKVKIGHWQEGIFGIGGDQELKGFVTALEYHEPGGDNRQNAYSIWADMHLYPETMQDFSEGRYPEVSIGSFRSTTDKDGSDQPQLIEHVALLGAERAALPDLEGGTMLSSLLNILEPVLKMFGFAKNITTAKEDNSVSKEFLSLMQEYGETVHKTTTQFLKTIAIEKGSGTGGQDKPATKPEPKSPKYTAAEIDTAFNELHGAGKLAHDQKAKFSSLAENAGLDFAKSFYADQTAPTPPAGNQTSSSGDVGSDELRKSIKREYPNFTAEQIEDRVKRYSALKVLDDGTVVEA